MGHEETPLLLLYCKTTKDPWSARINTLQTPVKKLMQMHTHSTLACPGNGPYQQSLIIDTCHVWNDTGITHPEVDQLWFEGMPSPSHWFDVIIIKGVIKAAISRLLPITYQNNTGWMYEPLWHERELTQEAIQRNMAANSLLQKWHKTAPLSQSRQIRQASTQKTIIWGHGPYKGVTSLTSVIMPEKSHQYAHFWACSPTWMTQINPIRAQWRCTRAELLSGKLASHISSL